jgi:hypothetical protein
MTPPSAASGEDTMIDHILPPERERDLALGRFMDAWSELEATLRSLLSVLSGAPSET